MNVDLYQRAKCFDCKTPLLAAVSFDVKDRSVMWCPACAKHWWCEDAHCELYWPPRTMFDGTAFHPRPQGGGVRYHGHVNPDGTIFFDIDKAAAARLTPWEVSAIADALAHLQLEARRLLTQITGADGYTFVCQDNVYRVRHMGGTAYLVQYKASPRRLGRGPRTCSNCTAPIPVGTMAYRYAEPKDGDSRFCAKCVESAPDEAKQDVQRARPALRMIRGGRR